MMALEQMITDEMITELMGFSHAEVFAFLVSLGLEPVADEDGDLVVCGDFCDEWCFTFDEDGSFIGVEDFSYED
jgi:hypothetical protein